MAKFTCTCGVTSTDSLPRSAADHCRFCGTRPSPELGVTVASEVTLPVGRTEVWTSTGHRWSGDDFSDFRCYDCDGRHHSHRKYPGDWGYESTVERGLTAASAA